VKVAMENRRTYGGGADRVGLLERQAAAAAPASAENNGDVLTLTEEVAGVTLTVTVDARGIHDVAPGSVDASTAFELLRRRWAVIEREAGRFAAERLGRR
jgi:hypothetical protein